MVGERGKRFRPGAEVIALVGQVGLFAEDARQHAALQPALADARVEHRRFAARIRADDEDRVRLVDARDRRIEQIGRAAEFRMQLRTVLAAVDVRRAELGRTGALSANISSTVARSPTIAPIRDGDVALTLPAIAPKASAQLAGLS